MKRSARIIAFLASCGIGFAQSVPAQTPGSTAGPAPGSENDTSPAPANLPEPATFDPALLKGTPLEPLAPYIGTWEISANWSSGPELWARATYRVLMHGAFVEATTTVSDAGKEPYVRYRTLFAWDPEAEAIIAHGFTHTGAVSQIEMKTPENEADPADPDLPLLTSEWDAAPGPDTPRIRQHNGRPEAGAFRWQVWMIPNGSDEAIPMMDGLWIRQNDTISSITSPSETADMPAASSTPPNKPYPIDASLFVGTGEQPRGFTKTTTIGALRSDVFQRLSTSEGIHAFLGIESTIELAVGGAYEWYFLDAQPYGTKGGEGNQILAYVPDRMLSFSWNAPPSQPESRAKRTWVTIELADTETPDQTLVRLTHLGFGDAPEWQETYDYFDSAWGRVLQGLKTSLE